jgi:formiminotetrahydrofolate cyclodeaminase
MKTGEQTIAHFLDALAAKQSTPGGGGAAALTGSQAAALVSMVINFTLGNPKYAAVEEEMAAHLVRSEALRGELLALADADVAAFTAVSACYGMPRSTEAEKAARTAAMQAALQEAARVPLRTARACLGVLELVAPVAARGNVNVVSDAATALLLAEAALRSALVNVDINLKLIKDVAFHAEATAQREALVATCRTAVDAGRAACEATLGIVL